MASLQSGQSHEFGVHSGQSAHLHIAHGALRLDSQHLWDGDALTIEGGTDVVLVADSDSGLMAFDLA